jgi:hypothetical protein
VLISRSDSFIDNDDREYFAMAYAWISGSTPNTAKTSVEGEPVEACSAGATGSATDARCVERCPELVEAASAVDKFGVEFLSGESGITLTSLATV